MDDCDRADMWIEVERAQGVRLVRDKVGQEGAADCEVCGEDLTPERREAMPCARTCVECQAANERRVKAYRR